MNYLHSLTGRLFNLVFGGYVLLAIFVTIGQLSFEYSAIQKTISTDLVALGQAFTGGVAGAMWELDRPLLKIMAQGIAQSSIVTGVKITSDKGEIFAQVGEIPTASTTTSHELLAPFQFNTTRLVKQTPNGIRDIGSLAIYTNRSVALERIKYSFIVILINSLIKTAGLWVIFYLVISRSIVLPLSRVTEVISQLKFASESKQEIALDYPHEDELGHLMGAMRIMQQRLSAAHKELDLANHHLEAKVAERTRQLSEALDFNETILLDSPLPMGVYAVDGQCVVVNDAYARLTGATRKELLAQNYTTIVTWQKSGLLEACLEAVAQHRPQNREINVVSSFGKEIWCDCRILPTRLNDSDHLLIQLVDLTERKRLEEELRYQAYHDPLTRLPNRRFLMDRLQQAIHNSKRQNSYFAVFFLDLNKFKQLNDTYGHEVGDQMLIAVADRLKLLVRETDTIARLGGDEFVILLEGLGSKRETAEQYVASIAGKFRNALCSEYILGVIRHQSSVSLGIRLCMGNDTDPDKILQEADDAMYGAKKSGHIVAGAGCV